MNATIQSWIMPVVIVVIYGLLAFYFYPWLILKARRRLRHADDMWRDLLFFALRWPLVIALSVLGAMILTESWPLSPQWRGVFRRAELIAVIIIAVMMFQHWVITAYRVSSEDSWLRITLLRKLLLIGLYVVALLMILDELGIGIGAPLVSLGVVSLAVGLAVREILANFFAGIQLAMERPLETGQTIILENGMAGRVIWINWLNTHLRAADGSLLIVPNAKLLGFIVRNLTLAEPHAAATVVLAISRASDLERAEQVALETARRLILTVGGAVAGPTARYTSLTATAAELTVTIGGPGPAALDDLRSGYLKAVNRDLAEAGINLA